MNIPSEAYEILILVALVSIAMVLVSCLTKSNGNYRSRRNRRARKQF